jgi:hypothetical protein
MEHFVDCIEARATPMTSGQSGLRVVRMLESAMASLSRRGAPVEIAAQPAAAEGAALAVVP